MIPSILSPPPPFSYVPLDRHFGNVMMEEGWKKNAGPQALSPLALNCMPIDWAKRTKHSATLPHILCLCNQVHIYTRTQTSHWPYSWRLLLSLINPKPSFKPYPYVSSIRKGMYYGSDFPVVSSKSGFGQKRKKDKIYWYFLSDIPPTVSIKLSMHSFSHYIFA